MLLSLEWLHLISLDPNCSKMQHDEQNDLKKVACSGLFKIVQDRDSWWSLGSLKKYQLRLLRSAVNFDRLIRFDSTIKGL